MGTYWNIIKMSFVLQVYICSKQNHILIFFWLLQTTWNDWLFPTLFCSFTSLSVWPCILSSLLAMVFSTCLGRRWEYRSPNFFCVTQHLAKVKSLDRRLFEIDSNDVIKLCPRLKDNVLNPSHFEWMYVRLSAALINNDVAAGLLYCIATNKIQDKHRTTAWFLKTTHQLLWGISFILKQQRKLQRKYCIFKIFQTDIILATQTALDFQEIYLEKNFKYLFLGRLTLDALDNAISSLRSRQSVPNAHFLRVSLRLVCLSQFETNLKRSAYEDHSHHLINTVKTTNWQIRAQTRGLY